mgnify:CR=1 FL=1
MKPIESIERKINPSKYEVVVGGLIAAPVFFLIRTNWVVGLALLLLLAIAYWYSSIFKELRKSVSGFWFLSWGYSAVCTVAGISISEFRDFYDSYKGIYIAVAIIALLFLVKPYKEMRKLLNNKEIKCG